MKRLSLYLFLIFLTLQTPSWTDDIRDFLIEGISIGDSALVFFNENEIKKNSKNFFKKKDYTLVQNDKYSFFETYDAIDFIYKTNDNDYYLCLVSGDKYISEEKLTSIIEKKVTKASADEVKTQTGFSIGGVPPVAHNSPPSNIFIDHNLKHFDIIFAAAGHPYVIFGITFENLCEITKGDIRDFVN